MHKILIMGKGSTAIHAVNAVKKIYPDSAIFAIPEFPPPDWMQDFSKFCDYAGIPPMKYEEISGYEAKAFQLGISCFSSHIFIEQEIDKFEVLLNLHNSPLPKYRGVNPINWALKNNETYHGVSIHKIDDGIDTGDVYAQILFGINHKKDEVIDVYEMSIRAGKKLIDFTLENLNNLTPFPQNSENFSYHSKNDFPLLMDRSDFSRNPNFNKKRLDL
jgi:methionyl-tRNA formyltransferase